MMESNDIFEHLHEFAERQRAIDQVARFIITMLDTFVKIFNRFGVKVVSIQICDHYYLQFPKEWKDDRFFSECRDLYDPKSNCVGFTLEQVIKDRDILDMLIDAVYTNVDRLSSNTAIRAAEIADTRDRVENTLIGILKTCNSAPEEIDHFRNVFKSMSDEEFTLFASDVIDYFDKLIEDDKKSREEGTQ